MDTERPIVLIVGPHRNLRQVLVDVTLENLDVEVIEVPRAGAAKTFLARRIPDLVVVDVSRFASMRLVWLAHFCERYPHVPILVLSGSIPAPERLPGHATVSCLQMPFTLEDYLQVASDCLRSAGVERVGQLDRNKVY